MHPSDALAAMTADGGIGLMLDRRVFGADRPPPAAFEVLSSIELTDTDPSVRAWLVRASGATLPSWVVSAGFGNQTRLMDRFYLPEKCDPSLVRAMFDLIAEYYDELLLKDVNLTMARMLLERVLQNVDESSLVLDFGCGTGIATQALAELGREASLVGVDLSSAMLHHALARKETVMSIDKWRAAAPVVECGIASFVFHYNVPLSDLTAIARSIRPGGAFAANYFRGAEGDVDNLIRIFESENLLLVERTRLRLTGAPDVILTFRKSS